MGSFVRFILFALALVFIISFLRSIVGLIGKAVSGLTEPEQKAADRRSPPAGGELKKDPVCGTYVSTSTPLRKTVDGETVYFCSQGCLDKYKG